MSCVSLRRVLLPCLMTICLGPALTLTVPPLKRISQPGKEIVVKVPDAAIWIGWTNSPSIRIRKTTPLKTNLLCAFIMFTPQWWARRQHNHSVQVLYTLDLREDDNSLECCSEGPGTLSPAKKLRAGIR